MKKLFLLLTLAIVFSCSKDSINTPTTADLVQQKNLNLSAKDQSPLASLDNDTKGIYLGVYVSGTTEKRGLIWINLANNNKYDAIVEMVNGETIKFQGQLTSKSALQYLFTADNAQFNLEIINKKAVITNASYHNEQFFGALVKDKSNTRAMAETGTYTNAGGVVLGTWNLIADGTIVDPNGFGGEGITDVFVTRNSQTFNDTTFENFNFVCAGISSFVPVIVDFDGATTPDTPAVWNQTSDFNGVTTWGLIMNGDGGVDYADENCNPIPSGTFNWNGAVTGNIYIDI